MDEADKANAKTALVRWLDSQDISPPNAVEILNEVLIDIIQIMIEQHKVRNG